MDGLHVSKMLPTLFSLGMAAMFALTHVADPAAACQKGMLCRTSQGAMGFCVHGACIDHIQAEVRNNLRFKIVVKYPDHQLKMHGLPEMMYIRGLDQGFNWLAGGQMTRTQNDTWETKVRYTSSQDGFRCHMCTDMTPIKHNKLEYRIFLDNGIDMKGGTFVVNFPLSSVSSYFDEAPEIHVYPWFFRENGTVSDFNLWSTLTGHDSNITVFMPPSFTENTYKKYPVFIAFDISYDLAESIRYIFEDPINMGVAAEYVVLGYADYNMSSRTELLTPSRGREWGCLHGTFMDYCAGCLPSNVTSEEYYVLMKDKCGKVIDHGGMGDSTLDFLTHDALRKAEQHCDNRLLLDRENLGIIGYSLGGLMACHAAWTRPHVFGLAACQSPSLWWPSHMDQDRNISNEFEFLNQTLKNPILWQNRPRQKIYIDVGGGEGSYMGYAAVEAATVMAKHGMFKENENMWVNVFPGDPHTLAQWAMRIWKPISTLLPMPWRPHKPNGSGHGSPVATSASAATRPTSIPGITDIHVPHVIG